MTTQVQLHTMYEGWRTAPSWHQGRVCATYHVRGLEDGSVLTARACVLTSGGDCRAVVAAGLRPGSVGEGQQTRQGSGRAAWARGSGRSRVKAVKTSRGGTLRSVGECLAAAVLKGY